MGGQRGLGAHLLSAIISRFLEASKRVKWLSFSLSVFHSLPDVQPLPPPPFAPINLLCVYQFCSPGPCQAEMLKHCRIRYWHRRSTFSGDFNNSESMSVLMDRGACWDTFVSCFPTRGATFICIFHQQHASAVNMPFLVLLTLRTHKGSACSNTNTVSRQPP